MDTSSSEVQKDPTNFYDAPDYNDVHRLRELIFGLEYQQLIAMKARFENERQRADDIADVLPQALRASVTQSPALVSELTGIIEQAIQASVRRNPQPLVDAIFPVLGPAIRKAIRATLNTMLQSLNQTIEQGLSIKALSWRFRAWCTGKSYAEYLILKTMLFQVEQVFVIHKESGLLLNHVQSENTLARDPDMVSGMLSAIQDFVRDSFQGKDSDILESMQFGDMTVMLEAEPDVVMALVVSGKPPASLREMQIEVLEAFQLRYADSLSDFDGETAVFDNSADLLQGCLINQRLESSKLNKPFRLWKAWLVVSAAVLIVVYWQYRLYTQNQQWQSALDTLRAEPGVIVINAGKSYRGYWIELLKDPLAREPEMILNDAIAVLGQIDFSLTPFISLDQRLILGRAAKKLHSPPDIEMQIENGVLKLTGTADEEWLEKTTRYAFNIAGVDSLDVTGVNASINTDELVALKIEIENTLVYFNTGDARLDGTGYRLLPGVTAAMIRLQHIMEQQGRTVVFNITGHSDLSGTDALRQKVSRDRAYTVYQELHKYGVDRDNLSYVGAGTKYYSKDLANNRRVSFHALTKKSSLKGVEHGL